MYFLMYEWPAVAAAPPRSELRGGCGNPARGSPGRLHAVDALADEDVHRNAAVLGLAFGRVIARKRV